MSDEIVATFSLVDGSDPKKEIISEDIDLEDIKGSLDYIFDEIYTNRKKFKSIKSISRKSDIVLLFSNNLTITNDNNGLELFKKCYKASNTCTFTVDVKV